MLLDGLVQTFLLVADIGSPAGLLACQIHRKLSLGAAYNPYQLLLGKLLLASQAQPGGNLLYSSHIMLPRCPGCHLPQQ